MDNEEDTEAKICSFPPKSPLMDVEAMEERDLGMQKDVKKEGGVLIGEKDEDLPSPPNSKEAENDIQSKDMYAPPVDQATVFPLPLCECDVSIQDESEQGELVAVEDAPGNTEPKVEGLDEMRQGEPPVEVEQEPDVRDPAEIEQQPDVEAPDDVEPNALDPLETEPEQQDLVVIQPDQPVLNKFETDQQAADALESSGSRSDLHVGDVDDSFIAPARSDLHVGDADEGFIAPAPRDGEFELGRVNPEEGNLEEPQDQLVDDATEISCMAEEPQEQLANDDAGPFCTTKEEPQEQLVGVNAGGSVVDEELSSKEAGGDTDDVLQAALELVDLEAVSEKQFQDGCAEPPVSEEWPGTPVSDEALLIKEPSLSTPAMEALIDGDDEVPLHEQESYGILDDSEQHLDAEETHEQSAGGDGQCAAEGISNQLELEVDNNDEERAENNASDEDVPLAAATNSACEGLVSSGEEVRMNTPSADEPDGKKELGNETPFVFKQDLDIEQGPIKEEPSMEPQSDQAFYIKVLNAVEQEPLAQSLDIVPLSSEVEMAAETYETGDEAVDEDVPSAATADRACEGLVSSGQDSRTKAPSADKPDGKEQLGNETPFVFKQDLDTEQAPINKEPSIESQSEQELDTKVPDAVEQEPLAQSLDTVPSSSELEMATETHGKGDGAIALVAEEGNINEQELGLEASVIKQERDVEGGVAAVSALVEEEAVTNKSDESITEIEPSGWALNREQGFDNPEKKEKLLLEASDGQDLCQNKQSGSECLTAEQDKSSVQISDEVNLALVPEGETGSSEAGIMLEASNGQLDEDDLNRKVQDEQGSVNLIPCSDNLMEVNHIDENCDRSSSLSEPSSETEQDEQEVCPSAHISDNGDFLQSFPFTDNGGKTEGSYVGLLTVPVLEFGKVIDVTSKLKPSLLENGLVYHRMTPENYKLRTVEPHNSESKDESTEVNEVGTQAVKAGDRDLNAGDEREIVGAAKGTAADMGTTSSSKPLVLENSILQHNEGDIGKESMGEEYMNGTASASIADTTVENAEAFCNARSQEVSLSLVVPQQRDMNQWVSEKARQEDAEHTNGKVTLVQRTNWWGCCGMLDLLLRKD